MSTTATPRTVIVCLPADDGTDWLNATTAVAAHTDNSPTLAPVFPLRRGLFRFWSRIAGRRLLGAARRNGLVTHAAGGRLRRLNLAAAGQAAWLEATARWATWRHITAGLKPAAPWQVYERRHRQAPDKFSLPDARRAFLAQPAVAAMLAHNAVPGARHLDPYELDGFQAGQRAYATSYMLAATCGHAMLTTDGMWLQPDGESFTDRTNVDLAAALADTQPRDMLLLRLLEAHQVLSTSQIHTLLFPSLRVCQKRLARLRALGLVASFRRRDHAGRRQPAYWVLGPAGMRRQAIANGEPVPTDRTILARRDRIVASPTLSHRLGLNQFFVDLIAYARTRPGVELVRWWPEERATTLLRPVVPDGHGAWQVGERVWAWFVEYDTGSMDLRRLVERMAGYDQAARANKRYWPVLWWLHSPVRERNLHRELAGRSGLCPIATASRTPDGPGPGGVVWRLAGASEQRWELHQLGQPTDDIDGRWSDDYTDP